MDYKKVGMVGGLLVVALLTLTLVLTPSEIQKLLDENPTAQLILIEGFEDRRLELVGRTFDPATKYHRFVFEENYVKSYIDSDLISTTEWQIFNGTVQISDRRLVFLDWEMDRTSARVVSVAEYFDASNNSVGFLTRTVQIWPDTFKESVNLSSDVKNLRLQFSLTSDNYADGVRINLFNESKSFLEYPDLTMEWVDDAPKVTSAMKYGNGKIIINFARGEYAVDPSVRIGKYHVSYSLVGEAYGRKYGADLTFGNLPISITVNKDWNVSISDLNAIFEPPENPLGHNITRVFFEAAENVSRIEKVWVSNVTCVEVPLNGSVCRDAGFFKNKTVWEIQWLPVTASVQFRRNKAKIINIHAEWLAGVGSFSEDIIPFLSDVPLSDLAWWNSSWMNRKAIQVNTSSAQTSYQIPLNISYASAMQADFDDLRFTDEDGTALDYWVEEETNSVYSYVWVEGDWATTNGTQAYVYYNNSAAANTSSGKNTFVLFDDFDDASFNLTLWLNSTCTGSTTEASGKIIVLGECYLLSRGNEWYSNMRLVGSVNFTGGNTPQAQFGGVNNTNPSSTPMVLFQANYPTANVLNARTYVTASNASNLGDPVASDTFHRYEIIRNGVATTVFNLDWAQQASHTNQNSNNGYNITLGMYTATKRMESDWIFVADYIYPEPTSAILDEEAPFFMVIEMTSPAEDSKTEDTTPDMVFNFTSDTFAISSCELFINSTGYGVNSTVFNYTSTTMTANATLTYGAWKWKVTCTNDTYTNTSAEWDFVVRKLMSGNVKDDAGNNVENATVLIISQKAKTIYGTNSTGNDGNWTYEVWVAGNYTVVAYSWNDTEQDGDADPWIEVT
jgi:hypothetical protein